jgi:Holliday junction resolvase RusA-like endonuclease
MSDLLSAEAIERGLVAQGVPKEAAKREAQRQVELRKRFTLQDIVDDGPAIKSLRGHTSPDVFRSPHTYTGVRADGGSVLGECRRAGDVFYLQLLLPPRTKKNGTTLGIKQSKAYRGYRDAIIAALPELARASLGLPLPEREYNIAATYYVDRRGERADKVGLDQGLYDALENAGVVTNDWQFRTADGTRIVFGDPRPRVEITITPLET